MSMCGVCGAPATVGSMCGACMAHTEWLIRDTPGVLADLDVTTTKQAVQAAPGPGGSGDHMVLNLTASDTADELRAAVRVFAVCDSYRRPLWGFRACVRHPDTPGAVMRLQEAVDAARRVMDIPEERFTYGKCTCGRIISAARSRDSTVCPACGTRWDVKKKREEKNAEAMRRVSEYSGTIKNVLTVLSLAGHEVKRGNVDRWVHEGKLKPHIGGTKKYLAKDVASCAKISLP